MCGPETIFSAAESGIYFIAAVCNYFCICDLHSFNAHIKLLCCKVSLLSSQETYDLHDEAKCITLSKHKGNGIDSNDLICFGY